jgi:hypothetical protein
MNFLINGELLECRFANPSILKLFKDLTTTLAFRYPKASFPRRLATNG